MRYTIATVSAGDSDRKLLDRLAHLIEPDYGLPEQLNYLKVICQKQLEEVSSEQLLMSRAKLLLELVSDKLKDRDLQVALKETKQIHVFNYIKCNGSKWNVQIAFVVF